MEGAELKHEAYSGMTEIPPVISCAICGLSTCEGCTEREPKGASQRRSLLPWATEPPSMRTLSDTALVTTTGARAVFARLRGSSPTRALTFALLTELCALGSILAGTVLVLLLLAPRFTRALLGTGSVWLLCSALWLCAAVLVVALHLLWAALLERGIEKRGQPRSTWLAVEFGCYSCGWDLLTSPIGIWLSFEHGKRTGVARTSALLAAFRAPRPAMHAYLEQCRGLDADGARSVLRHAAAEATLVVLLATVLAVSVVLGLLLASWT